MMSSDSIIRRRKLSDAVFDQLVAQIEAHTLRPGDLLASERDLMASFGVGRPAIREALQALERMGMIEIRHGGRARVVEPSLGRMVDDIGTTMRRLLASSAVSLENLKEVRVTFEREMAQIAAEKASTSDIKRLQGILDRQRAAIADAAAFRALDGEFHREIAGIGGNPIWTSLSDALFGWLSDFHVDLVSVPGLESLTLDEHAGILAAIASGDGPNAGRAMIDHLTRANELYRRTHLRDPARK